MNDARCHLHVVNKAQGGVLRLPSDERAQLRYILGRLGILQRAHSDGEQAHHDALEVDGLVTVL